MKTFLLRKVGTKTMVMALCCLALVMGFSACKKPHEAPTLTITKVASGLAAPMGLETDSYGNIWVALAGTAKNDGKVVVVKPNGKVYDAIVHLSAIINENSGEEEGPAHLLLDNGMLYVTAANYLYKINVSGFKPGDAPIDGSTLPYEDIAAFSLNYPYVNNAHDSHVYGIVKGSDGDIYLTDAGANAIIHRKGKGKYTVLAEVPGVANPTPVGPPQVQSVPTGIIADGNGFLVTTLLGFPFPQGKAVIYRITMSGKVSIYQEGFTSLVDAAEGNWLGHLVLQYATFGAMGFNANSGALIWANGTEATQLAGGLNMPVGIKQVNQFTWYVTSMGDGTVLKVTYK